MDITIAFEDNGTAHDDLLLRVGDAVWRCDSYYLALDQGVLAKQEDANKIRLVLRALLENWRTAIVGLSNGDTAYLPYDFSDQCTAWLACEMAEGELLVRHGWAHVEGWSISPSAPPSYATKPAGFEPDGGPWMFSVESFLGGIARSIEAVT